MMVIFSMRVDVTVTIVTLSYPQQPRWWLQLAPFSASQVTKGRIDDNPHI